MPSGNASSGRRAGKNRANGKPASTGTRRARRSVLRGWCKLVDDTVDQREHVSLCEALDRVLNKGAVLVGDVVISVADIDLVYLGLQVVLCSIDTARREYGLKV